jgi:hypothetical protein
MAEQRESKSADSLPITNVTGLGRDDGGDRRALRAVVRNWFSDDMGAIGVVLTGCVEGDM